MPGNPRECNVTTCISDKIIIMEPMPVVRKINAQRRVGLPSLMATYVGISAKKYVHVSRAKPESPSLLVSPTDQESRGFPRRDADRSRRVTATLQVGLPAPLMDGLGLERGHLVFVSSAGQDSGVLVTPQQRARLVLDVVAGAPGSSESGHDGGVPVHALSAESGDRG